MTEFAWKAGDSAVVYAIAFSGEQWKRLTGHLLCEGEHPGEHVDEQLVFALAGHASSGRGTRLVVRELILAQPRDFDHQSPGGLRPTGEFVARALTLCRQDGLSLIEIHSHPFDQGRKTTFSGIDWNNDRLKMPAIAGMLPDATYHVTMVMGQASLDAHYYDRVSGSISPVEYIEIVGGTTGEPLVERRTTTSADRAPFFREEGIHARQVPLLGRRTQESLAQTRALIVGLGGLGSFATLELTHLGVGHLVLVDPDLVEPTNLNRLLGAAPSDVGRHKVDVYSEAIARISPSTVTITHRTSILDDSALKAARECDLMLGCIDSHGARLIMNRLAVQYMIPLIDAATGARRRLANQDAWDIGGQVQVVLPGLGCLECRGFIDPSRAAFDLASPEVQEYERERGYGTGAPAPSVIYLNGVVASLQASAVVAVLGVEGDPQRAGPIILYDAQRQSLTPAQVSVNPDCPTCGIDGVTGLADVSPIFEREAFYKRPPIPGLGGAGHEN